MNRLINVLTDRRLRVEKWKNLRLRAEDVNRLREKPIELLPAAPGGYVKAYIDPESGELVYEIVEVVR